MIGVLRTNFRFNMNYVLADGGNNSAGGPSQPHDTQIQSLSHAKNE